MSSSTSSSERTSRRLPLGLLLGALLFAAGERAVWSSQRLVAFAARYTPAGPDGDPLLIDAALLRLPELERGAPPLLLLGSSQIREGLDCASIEERLARPCRNLAISAGSPLDLLQIQAGLAALPERRLLVGIFPKLMHMEPKAGFVGAPALAAVLGSASRWRIGARGWLDLGWGALQRLVPTLRHKDGLAAMWGEIGGRLPQAWSSRLAPAPQRLLAGEPPKPPIYFERRVGQLDPDTALSAWTAAQEAALERLIAGEARRGGRLVLVDFPTRPGYESTLSGEVRAHWLALLERLRARGDLIFIEAAALGPLELEDFQDFTHLSQRGRARASARLAALLARLEP